MTEFFQFAVLGLGSGAVYVLLAQGVVLIQRGSGVVNFAQGAMAMLGAFLFYELTNAAGWSNLLALIAAVVIVGLLGVAFYSGVLRPLRNASTLTRVIATLALFIILEAIGILKWGNGSTPIQPILPTDSLNVGGVMIGAHILILVGIACGITAVLWAGFRYTLVGQATRGSAENPRAAATLGWSAHSLATLNWLLGGAFAALAGIFTLPVTGQLQVDQLALLVIPALAVALIGGFASFPITLAGGLALGIGQSLVGRYVNVTGATDAFPFFVIVIFLVFGGKRLPIRGYLGERTAQLGSGRVRPVWLVASVVVLLPLTLAVFSPSLTQAIASSAAYAIIILSVVTITGYAGQLSLAQMSLAGVGALIAGKLVSTQGWPFELAFLAAIVATIPIGLLFAIPALRTRGVSLAMVTLGLGAAITDLVFNNQSYVGSADGTVVGPQTVFGLSIDPITEPGRYAALAIVLLVLCSLAIANLRRSRAGRRLIAVRANERAAAALGISVYGGKLYAFGVAAALAAVGGVLLGFQNYTILYSGFAPLPSVLLVAWAVIGGLGYITSGLYAAPLVTGGLGAWFFTEVITGLDRWISLIGGVAVLVSLLVAPDGVAHANEPILSALRARFGRSRDTTPNPAPVELPKIQLSQVQPRTLEIRDLEVRFGGVRALSGATLTVRPGEVAALIGPNGAGKTTLIDAVTGFVKPAGGTVLLDGAVIDGWSVHRRARAGLARSFQSLELFEDITVRENFYAASDARDLGAYATALVRPGADQLTNAAIAAIREFGLADDLDKRPGELSYGRRRLVAIARTVATSPSVLLLDEPVAGLDEHESAEVADLVRGLADRAGIGILVVEHDMSFVMSIADRITVLDFGAQIAEGAPTQVRADPTVIAAYLGAPG